MRADDLDGSAIQALLSRAAEVEKLHGQVRGHVEAINDLFAQIAEAVNGVRAGRRGRRGRARARSARGARGPRRRPVKRGALKAAIHKVLAGGKTLAPTAVVKAVRKLGLGSPYGSVYIALKNDKAIQKTAAGFRLKTRPTMKAAKTTA